jgi:hypothetical protein
MERRGAYRALVGRAEGKTPLRRPKCRWDEIIKVELTLVGRVWTRLIWLRIGRSGRLL